MTPLLAPVLAQAGVDTSAALSDVLSDPAGVVLLACGVLVLLFSFVVFGALTVGGFLSLFTSNGGRTWN